MSLACSRRHLKGFSKTRALATVHWRHAVIVWLIVLSIAMHGNHSNIDSHIVSQIFIPRNEGCAVLIFETHATSDTIIDTIKVFDCGHNGVGSIMRENLNSHWNSSSELSVVIEEKLEGDVLRRSTWRVLLLWSHITLIPIHVTIVVSQACKALCSLMVLC